MMEKGINIGTFIGSNLVMIVAFFINPNKVLLSLTPSQAVLVFGYSMIMLIVVCGAIGAFVGKRFVR